MSKKFAKLLVFSAAIGSAIGAAYYFARKKNAEADSAEEDYDDFSEDEDTKSGDSRSYVPLSPDGDAQEPQDAPSSEESPKEEAFTPLAETVQNAEETVEEFFDEDSTDEEPPITHN